jgi:plastocyanin
MTPRPLQTRLILPALFALAALIAAPARAEDAPSFTLTLKDHKFDPAELEVPKGTKIKLVVKNLDPTPEEFESSDLKREKVVAGHSEITLSVGPLQPGRYAFYGEFNEKTAQGALVVKP